MADEIYWEGASGTKYNYWIHPIGTPFKEEGGNYIFSKETQPGYWTPIYIGQTENLNQRLENHEKEGCARQNGATHVHAHTTGTKDARFAEETDLIRRWNTPCNRT